MRKVGNAIMLKIGGQTINYRTVAGHMQGSDRSRWQQMEPVSFLTYPSGRHITAQWVGDTLLCTCDRETQSTRPDAKSDGISPERPRMSQTCSETHQDKAPQIQRNEPRAKKRSGTGTAIAIFFGIYAVWHIWHAISSG